MQEHQEIAKHIEQSQYQNVPLRVEKLASERDLQSIVPVPVRLEAKSELVDYTESLPEKFADYSLLSIDEKVKRYQMTGKEDAYAMVEAYFKRIGHPIYFGEVYDEAKEL